jgi:glycosyltransferase involved in cell wall biosynthesis
MVKVFIICSGLGHVKRGFESFTQELFAELSQIKSLEVTLFKGGGKPAKKEIPLWNLPRNSQLNIAISQLFKKSHRREPYFIEQLSFFISLLPHIQLKKPDVIYFSDVNLGTLLWHWRRLTKQKYKLLFNNGGPCQPDIFDRWDRIRQVSPNHLHAALDVGIPAAKQSLILDGIYIPSEPQILPQSEREALRRQLRLPEKQPLILSVAAINKSHKRMDYLIREVASLPEPRPYLLLLGQQDTESPEILQLGNELLGGDNFQIKTVAQDEVTDYYKIADAFVLASVREGLPRSLIEAMSHGLPCLAHDYETTRFVLGNEGYLGNLELPNSLTSLIPQALAEADDVSKRRLRHHRAYERFSWEKLRPEYLKLIECCVKPYSEIVPPVIALENHQF